MLDVTRSWNISYFLSQYFVSSVILTFLITSLLTHHKSQSQDKGDDGAPPRVRVLVLVKLGEERLEVVGVGDALALEELLALHSNYR